MKITKMRKAKSELIKRKKEIDREQDNKIYSYRRKLYLEYEGEIKIIDEKLEKLNIDIEKYEKENSVELTKEEYTWFRNYFSSEFYYGHFSKAVKVIYISPKRKFILATIIGRTASTGAYYEPFYAPSEHLIVEIGRKDRHGFDDKYQSQSIEGRLTKAKKQELINEILELENNIKNEKN